MAIRYIADLSLRDEWPPERALSAAGFDSDIYTFDVGHPTGTNYWTDWGGTYDNPTSKRLEIFFKEFLQQVTSSATLELTENSFWLDGDSIYMNLPQKPWLYKTSETELLVKQGYQTLVRDVDDSSDDTYNDAIHGVERYPVLLNVPSVPLDLSDPVSGTKLFTKFKFTLINNDGRFDDVRDLNIENTPVTIKRSDEDIPDLDDYSIIRKGKVGHVAVNSSTFTVNCEDIFTTLREQATRKFTVAEFPDLPDTNVDKNIPLGWNTLDNVPLFEVGTGEYIAIDQDYLSSVTTVYDADGVSISFSVTDGIISATDAETADIIGKTNYTIGKIITEEIEEKSNIVYNSDSWDTSETDTYISISKEVGFYFKGGKVRDLVTEVLKSDSAFLFTKNNGLLTLRQDGRTYINHYLESWQIMSIPTKSTEESKRYFSSSVLVNFNKNQGTGNYNDSFLDDSQEDEIIEEFRRDVQGTYNTDLLNSSDASDFADRILNRFGTIYEMLVINLSSSTINITPLDFIFLDININGRVFSPFNKWKVRKIDPAQDVLVLESVDTVEINTRIIDTGESRCIDTGENRITVT